MNEVTTLSKNLEKLDLLKSVFFKGSTDEEFKLFVHACERTGLDPFMKQIHAVKRNSKQPDGTWKPTMTIQTGIDGYRLIAERTGKYSPGKESVFSYDENKRLLSATAFVKKQTPDGTWHEVSATAFYSEYCQCEKSGEPTRFWKTMPHGQLAKCAEALALRKAFPAELSGVYTKEEMQQAENDSENLEVIAVSPKNGISEEQVQELEMMMKDCESSFIQRMYGYIQENYNGKSLEFIPKERFQVFKAHIVNHLKINTKELIHA